LVNLPHKRGLIWCKAPYKAEVPMPASELNNWLACLSCLESE